mmetsp:Transcript_95021/g.165012  ORF Transcript_95021/g.165012 Transcript_95021/m.165012 type:complete len:1063 (-) Transcript_95021:83-3271(-)
MQPSDEEKLWDRTPGWESDESDSEDEEEEDDEELAKRAAAKLEEVAGILGDRWLDVPFIDFTPVPIEATTSPTQQYRPPPPSKWGNTGPPPGYRIEHVRAPIVKETLGANGLQQTKGKDWLVMWSGPRMRDKEYHGLHELQRVNHFPGSTELTRKDRLCVHFNKMARRFGGDAYNFVPETYVLPKQIDEFLDKYENSNSIWIVKPNASSQGRGIFLLRDLDQLPLEEVSVVSRYVDNPLLIQGLKFDLRVYVLVTSFEPLRAYVYREGLTRFASKPYSTEEEHLSDVYRHLTNYSINKNADNFVENQEVHSDNVGHKWSFSALNKHLKVVGVDSETMWSRIMDLILKTLLSVRPNIAAETRRTTAHSANCFELYGFDVLVDKDLKPWLLEVNLSPSMLADSPLDRQVKSAVLSETFNLVGLCHPSWRALATARLRSQLVQARNSASPDSPYSPQRGSAMAKSLAGANRLLAQGANGLLPANAMFNRLASAGCLPVAAEDSEEHEATRPAEGAETSETQPEKQSMPRLSELEERDLKALAHGLREFVRFREPDRCPNFIRLYPTRSTTEQYSSLMRGQFPLSPILSKMLYSDDEEEEEETEEAPEEEQPTDAESSAPAPEYGRVALRGSDSPPSYPASKIADLLQKDDKTEEKVAEERAPAKPEPPPLSVEEALYEALKGVGTAASVPHDPLRAAGAVTTLRTLGTKACSRLALLEYLARLTNVCDKVRQANCDLEKVEVRLEPCRQQLMVFRQHLSVYLRTSSSRSPPPSTGDFLEELTSTSRAAAACIAGELKAAVSIGLYASVAQGSKGPLSLEQMLPSGFKNSSRGERSVHTLRGLSSADLEFVLRSPECAPEFLPMLEGDPDEEEDWQTAFTEDSFGAPSGPLTALLTALTPSRHLLPSAPKATVDVMQRTSTQLPPALHVQALRQQAGFLPSLKGVLPPPRQPGRQGPAIRQRTPPAAPPMSSMVRLTKLAGSRSLPLLPGTSPPRPPPLLRQLLAAPVPSKRRRASLSVGVSGGEAMEVGFRGSQGLSGKLAGPILKPLPQMQKMTADLLRGDIEF